MPYVDGFVIPIPTKNLDAYRRMAQKAARVWLDHGALEFRECVGDDLDVKMGRPFPRQLAMKRGETVVFSWIVYESRAHRDRVNAKVMKDPRLSEDTEMPFDVKRMLYGGFKTIVDHAAGAARARGERGAPTQRADGGARKTGRAERAGRDLPPPAQRGEGRGGGRRRGAGSAGDGARKRAVREERPAVTESHQGLQ